MEYMIIDIASIINLVMPILLTGFITFLISRYSYNRSRPLNNYKFAYDNVYYPILVMMKKQDSFSERQFIAQIDYVLTKNYKYIDRGTLLIFKQYKSAYYTKQRSCKLREQFEDNIYRLNLSRLKSRDSCFIDFVTSISTGVTSGSPYPSL